MATPPDTAHVVSQPRWSPEGDPPFQEFHWRLVDLLERYAEPFAALAACLGRPYPSALLARAWNCLLQNQPHDALCGGSSDPMPADRRYRFDQCERLGEKIARDSLHHIAAQVNTTPPLSGSSRPDAPVKPRMPDPLGALVVFNPLGWPRTDTVEAIVEIPARLAPPDGQIALRGPQGDAVPCVVQTLADRQTLPQAPVDRPIGDTQRRWNVRFAAAVPPLGYQTYFITPERPAPFPPAMVTAERSMENAFLKLEVAENGTLTVTEKETGHAFYGALVVEAGGETADGDPDIPPEADRLLTVPVHRFTVQADSTRGSLPVRWEIRIPAGRVGAERSESEPPVLLDAEITLRPTARCLEIAMVCNNAGFRKHRLRLLFPTGLANATHVHGEQVFDLVARPIALPEGAGGKEPPLIHPIRTFVDVSDGVAGLALLAKGLLDVDVRDDPQRTLALTLLPATSEGDGAPEQPGAGQRPETLAFVYALYPHAGDWEAGRVWQEAQNVNVPLRALQTDLHAGTLPRSHAFFTVAPETLVPSAIKRSEDGLATVFRAFNIGSVPVTPTVLPSDVLHLSAATRVRMDEEPDTEALEVLPPQRVATWRFTF